MTHNMICSHPYAERHFSGTIKVTIAPEEETMNIETPFASDLHPDSIIAKVWRRNHALQAKIAHEVQTKGIQLSCPKNCCACCDYYFYISPAEYFTLKHYLLSTAPQSFLAACETATAQWTQLKEAYPEEHQRLVAQTSTLADDHEYMNRFAPCPLLQNGLCSAYEARPLICQLYGTSYTAGFCDMRLSRWQRLFKKDTSNKQAQQMYVGIDPTSNDLRTGIEYYMLTDPQNVLKCTTILNRAYPIVYWLAHDVDYASRYQQAVRLPLNDFWKYSLV